MAFVIVEKGNSKDIGKRITLGDKPLIIGRDVPGNAPDIVLHSEFVSRQHAEISHDEKGFMLRDLKSTNGTSLDGRRLEPGKTVPLKHDSVIGLAISPDGARVSLRYMETPTVSTTRIEGALLDKTAAVDWLNLDEKKGEVRIDGKLLILSRKEYDLILFLSKRAGSVCQRDELIAGVWPEVLDPGGVSDAAIDQLVHRLRLKIEPDPSHPRRLVSRKGFGFMLV